MKLNEIQDLIKFVAKSGVSEVELEIKDFKINIKTCNPKKEKEQQQPIYAMPQMQMMPQQQQVQAAPQPQVQASAPQPQAKESAPAADSNLITIKSPMIGTFYRKPSPEKDAFVNVGDSIKKGDTICVIEAMKLFNEIEAELGGKIVKVLAEDGQPVEYDQPLFLVEPA